MLIPPAFKGIWTKSDGAPQHQILGGKACHPDRRVAVGRQGDEVCEAPIESQSILVPDGDLKQDVDIRECGKIHSTLMITCRKCCVMVQ